MKKINRVIIFTEGGDNIGFGHITRCSALYEEIESRDIEVLFVIFGKNIDDLLKGKKYLNKDWKDREFLKKFLKEDDYIIIDSYLADIEIYKIISQKVFKVICLDDYNRIIYPKNVLTINLGFRNILKSNYYFGIKYIILRKEFLFKYCDKVKNKNKILIIIGGNDIKDITGKIVEIVKKNFPHYQLNIVSKNKKLKKIITSKDKIFSNLKAKEIIGLIQNSYIAISACGQTLFELSKIGIATIGIKIADNQKNNIKYFTENKYLEYVGNNSNKNLERNIINKLKKIEDDEENYKKILIGKKLTQDINGAKEIIKLLLEEIIENNSSNN